jgi:predicted RNA-binding Zn-ribbon protein involved in translation (DUF1610 family)
LTQHEIVALRCPSCGGGITQPSREMAFGAEFRCDHCGITSVLIIDRALVPLSSLQKQGEKVCTACGRVAQREARFCQEGHALVRKCTKCLAEFAVDHQRCDSCGWPQSVKLDTVEGEALAFDRAVSDLADPSYSVLHDALKVITAGGGTASSAAVTAAASAIHSLMMDPSFRRRSYVNSYNGVNDTEMCCLEALATLGPAARQAVPMLQQRIEEMWRPGLGLSTEMFSLLRCLGAVSPEDALAYCSRSLEERGKNDGFDDINRVVQVAFTLGKIAIPTLEQFCGPFSGNRGTSCKRAISALRNGQKTLSLPSY